jgi:hypothetical protein
MREPSRIVHQQPDRRQASAGAEYCPGAPRVGEVGDHFPSALRHRVGIMVDVCDHVPSVGKQRSGDHCADPLACSGDDGCPFRSHCRQLLP